MANFHEVFKERHAVLPVVHVTNTEQAIKNVGIALEQGADGVFLFSTVGRSLKDLNIVHAGVKRQFPDFWVGVNYHDLVDDPIEVFPSLKPDINGVWLEDAQINPLGQGQLEALRINMAREDSGWTGLYFGGVAFKYRDRVSEKDLRGVAQVATKYMDVVTTSGDGTGHPPEVSKIETMRDGVGDYPLAIGSGMSENNIFKYLELADAFLVSSSLLVPYTEDFDPAKVKALVQAVRAK